MGDFVFSAEVDATGAAVPKPTHPDPDRGAMVDESSFNGPVAAGPGGGDWRPVTGPLPEDILQTGGNPPDWVLQKVASLQLNTSDNQVVQMTGTPFFRVEGPTWFLYANLKKADQYFFAKFA